MPNESMPGKENEILEIEILPEDKKLQESHVLRKKTEKIAKITPEIKELVRKMIKTSIEKGIGLAANQVGKSLRLFVVTLPDPANKYIIDACINPEIIKTCGKQEIEQEGCLSLPGRVFNVKRFENLTLRYQDETGQTRVIDASGLRAQVIQHEMDHLEGVLICDKARFGV